MRSASANGQQADLPDMLAGAYDIPGDAFWRATAGIWSLIAPIDHVGFAKAFRFHRAAWSPDCMTPRMRDLYDSLPPVVTLWRGQPHAFPLGLRWTQARPYAQVFAAKPESALYERQIPKAAIAFVTGVALPEFALFEPPA